MATLRSRSDTLACAAALELAVVTGLLLFASSSWWYAANTHRPHQVLEQAAPLRPLPDGVASLDQFRVQRRDRPGGVIHEYRLVA